MNPLRALQRWIYRRWRRDQIRTWRRDGWYARAVPRWEGVRYEIDDTAVTANGKPVRQRVRLDYMDEFESRDKVQHPDVLLRALVDRLTPEKKHLIERVYFGGDDRVAAAREIGLTVAAADRLQREALVQLREWLEAGAIHPAEKRAREPRTGRDSRCGLRTRWGRCAQPVATNAELCAAHSEWEEFGVTPDENYHRRVVLGEVVPIQAKLSETELSSTMRGRYRGDGRRLDAYVTHDEPLDLMS